MRCFLGWVAISILASSSVLAQQTFQYSRAVPDQNAHLGRSPFWVSAALPDPHASLYAAGAGTRLAAQPFASVVHTAANTNAARAIADTTVTIPQQGSVDMGVASVAQPAYVCDSPGCNSLHCDSPVCHSTGRSHGLGHLLRDKIGGGHCGGWFGGAYYMRLWRDDDRFGFPLAVNAAVPTNTVLSTGMAHMKDAGGLGVRVGKMLNNCNAVEFIYWQVFPDENPARAEAPVLGSPINSSLAFTDLTYFGTPVDDYFQGSQYQSVTRSFDYRNFEVNFLRLPYVFGGGCGGRINLALLAGVRWFRAEEGLEYFSDDLNHIPGDDPNNELRYHNHIENHLTGFQVGGLLNLQMTSRLSGQFGSKVGIYNNHIIQEQSVVGGGGGAIISAGPDAGQPFALRSKKDDVAFLGEFDAGIAYCINRCWRVTGGYKVLAISGYADSVNQIPYAFNSLSTTGLIQDNNSLILHGIYVGAERTW